MVVALLVAISFPGCSACSARRNLTDSQLMLRIRSKGYLFVKNKLIGSNNTQINGGSNIINSANVGTTKCPWKWAIDDDPDRIPRFLTKAVCPKCNHYCRAVFYSHNSLIQRCDRLTGMIYWSWMEKTMEIAYVFEPSKK